MAIRVARQHWVNHQLLGALETQDTQLASWALQRGANPNLVIRAFTWRVPFQARTFDADVPIRSRPVIVAARNGNDRIVETLLAHGARIDDVEYYTYVSPLAAAIQGNHRSTVVLLLRHGAKSNALEKPGYDAVNTAVMAGNVDILRLLLRDLPQAAITHDVLATALANATDRHASAVAAVLTQYSKLAKRR